MVRCGLKLRDAIHWRDGSCVEIDLEYAHSILETRDKIKGVEMRRNESD